MRCDDGAELRGGGGGSKDVVDKDDGDEDEGRTRESDSAFAFREGLDDIAVLDVKGATVFHVDGNFGDAVDVHHPEEAACGAGKGGEEARALKDP